MWGAEYYPDGIFERPSWYSMACIPYSIIFTDLVELWDIFIKLDHYHMLFSKEAGVLMAN